MLLTRATLEGIAEGRITLAFRRWRRPTVRAGGHLRTAIGVLAIDAVEPVEEDALTDREAKLAGYTARDALIADLQRRTEGRIYRIALRLAGEDPRAALREQTALAADDLTAIRARLARFDRASRHGPWTEAVLRLIARSPATRAADLAAACGRETQSFKRDVRKLKELGLTESLETGYRLSPRGRAWLDSLDSLDVGGGEG